ncbi:hypothetical protein C21_04217 [Arenibacter sp. NBRC 103722]|uniref:Uncharacterized protein n=1 Tax=Arenibacter algicola TaxID=616991 RepID=A0A221V404_9FLAO|nr:hypothetical protein AREALGSMS7_04922 [Arenibacter algicola]GBF22026.1 hypothetical protein C21_04217 [Arenibacter sp. NBRC 103722]
MQPQDYDLNHIGFIDFLIKGRKIQFSTIFVEDVNKDFQ